MKYNMPSQRKHVLLGRYATTPPHGRDREKGENEAVPYYKLAIIKYGGKGRNKK